MGTIDLDHNATTPLLPEAAEAMRAAPGGNPSSAHALGRKARQALEDARERIAALLGAEPDEVVFTSGATEANNLAIFGLLGPAEAKPGVSAPPLAITSHLEHPCVVEPLRRLEARGIRIEWMPIDARGRFAAEVHDPGTRLICLMLVNHETGAVQPVGEIARSLPPGPVLHCDAAQAVGKMPVSFRQLGVTTLAVSAHKFGGPKGIGALLVQRGTRLQPLFFGGHQERDRRPGTEPVALAVGMAAALDWCVQGMVGHRAKLETLRARLWSRLQEQAAPVVLNGPEIGAADVVPATLNVSFPGCRADLLLLALDLAGVACSTGSACSSGSLLPSPVLRAMGLPDDLLRSALRFSFGPGTDPGAVDEAAARIARAVRTARERAA
jgi:cysteine desulfurase